MEKGILINCNEMQVDGILKAAMVNAVTRIEKGAGRKERSDLRRFILECAKILFEKETADLAQKSQDRLRQDGKITISIGNEEIM